MASLRNSVDPSQPTTALRSPPIARWLVGVALLWTSSVSTAQPPVVRDGIFLDSLDVHLVNIEVVATGPDGAPYKGLTARDFRVFEDGDPVDVVNFLAVEDGRSVLDEASQRVPELRRTPLESPPLNLVVLVDNGRIRPAVRNHVFEGLSQHLDRLLGPGDRVAVVEHSRRVRFEQNFTADRALVEAALERLRETRVASPQAGERRRLLLEIETATSVGSAGLSKSVPALEAQTTLISVRQHARRTQDEIKRTVRLLDSLLGSIAGLPGRKAVLYVSHGFDLRPGEGLFNVWWDKYSTLANQIDASPPEVEVLRFDASPDLRDLIARASSSRVAFYTLGQSPAFESLSAEIGRVTTSTALRADAVAREESRVQLAQATGGYSITSGSGGVDTLLERLGRDFLNYYSLAYVSPHHGDGKLHRVRVTSEAEGVKLRYLEHYLDTSPEQRRTDRTTSALLLDVGDNPLEIGLEIGEETPQKQDRYLVPILVRVPIGKITLLPEGDRHVGKVGICLVIRDREGRLSEPHRAELPIEVPNDRLLEAVSSSAGYATNLLVRSGEQKIAVGVEDLVGSTFATVNLLVHVGRRG